MHTIIIPTLNEAGHIGASLSALQPLRARGFEVIVADGGSIDATPWIAEGLADCVLRTAKGRALQMNAAARRARGELLFFLHADTRLPGDFIDAARALPAQTLCWGRFDVKLSGRRWPFRIIETLINLRSRVTGIATGDQLIFISRHLYDAVGGFPEIALMEDVAISRRLKRLKRPLCLQQCVTTSSRRWEHHGVAATVIKMWWLRWRYFCGADPAALAEQYE